MKKTYRLAQQAMLCWTLLLPQCTAIEPENVETATQGPRLPAQITFLSQPAGATVVLNGKTLSGTTPLPHQAIEPGLSQIIFHLDGYYSQTRVSRMRPDSADRIDISSSPCPNGDTNTDENVASDLDTIIHANIEADFDKSSGERDRPFLTGISELGKAQDQAFAGDTNLESPWSSGDD